jgi:hypothetical protein
MAVHSSGVVQEMQNAHRHSFRNSISASGAVLAQAIRQNLLLTLVAISIQILMLPEAGIGERIKKASVIDLSRQLPASVKFDLQRP